MAFPWAEVESPAELPAGAFDGAAVAIGSPLTCAGEADPEPDGAAAAVAFDGAGVAAGSALAGACGDDSEAGDAAAADDVPPRLVT